jgi:TPR repeat protein
MVGVHHEHGLSVPQDLSLAYAWHRLAAERGNPKLMELRDIRGLKLTAEQQRLASELATGIQARQGDRALLTRSYPLPSRLGRL